MGFKKRKNKNKAKQGEPAPQKDYSRREMPEIVKENKNFEDFYTHQNIMPKNEIPEFLEALKRPLPQTFRFAGFKNSAKLLIKRMEESFLDNFEDLEIDGVRITKPEPMSWYPNRLAWSTTLSRTQLRRHPKLGEMHRFLIAESEAGYVTRQEAVSMIPPLFMDIKSDQKILDLCAAPGSKTSQIIELMHEDHENDPKNSKKVPEGFCIANDKNNKRCYMLVHQAKRLNSPSCIITNHDASLFPGLVTKDEKIDEFMPLEFDRILADVPCTGDGTMRKNFDIWKSWTAENSTSLHPTQVKILKRALELLKVGGKVIYSTCSLSPLEDEAVVGHVLSQCQGSAKLVDCSSTLPNLKRRKGISNWDVMLKDGNFYTTFEEQKDLGKTHITRSMFPPGDVEKLNLDRCMRFLPHDQDTGGFFVCVIEKTAKLPWESDKKSSIKKANRNENEKLANGVPFTDPNSTNTYDGPPCKKVKNNEKYRQGVFNEDPFYFFEDSKNNETIKEILKFYNLDADTFPTELLLSRSDHSKVAAPKHMYLVSPTVKEVLKYNSKRLQGGAGFKTLEISWIVDLDMSYF